MATNAYSPDVHLNLNIRGMGVSATLAINELSNQLLEEGKKVHKLGLGQSPFPVPKHVQQALRDNAHQKDYLPVKGLPALRTAVADYLKRTEGLDYNSADILIGPGTKELMFLIQLSYYGDLVIPTPSWVSYAPQAQIIGRRIQWLPTNINTGLGVTPEAIEMMCSLDPTRPRLLILNSPSNPTGLSYGAQQLKEIAEAAKHYKLLILSDEIYSGCHYTNNHVSIARYYPEGTIISNGLSKWCGAGGWRIGAFAFPSSLRWLLQSMADVASETYTSVSAPIQNAAVVGFQDHPEMDIYLENSRKVLGGLAKHISMRLSAAGASLKEPTGGFYVMPNFNKYAEKLYDRHIQNSMQLCTKI
ncbi:MAG: aminotransferase class I/II-fold pyridoxal phosphate-dependent enzyme, partial [Pseudomonadales bacterium]|nr:aminotransferase class I/II-fold pyridoxal phosphate-dependent enzyme [Pseudomonadales bacterium]